jgi:uncharacterized protein DUF4328
VSQPYPGPPGYHPGPYPMMMMPPVMPPARRYKPLRRITVVFLVLMALTTLATLIQALLMWRSYDDVKRFLFGQVSEDELDRGVQSIANTGPLLNVLVLLVVGTGVFFLIWLWQARENTEVFTPPTTPGARPGSGPHRREQGWVIGSWICPIVQFWYPLQVVEDVVRASEPAPAQTPGLVPERPHSLRAVLYGWWASWTAYWVIIVGGGSFALISFIVWVIRLVDRSETADATGDYVDIYDLQGFMVRTALVVNIGFTVAAALLVVAAATITVLMLRTNSWQESRMALQAPPPPIPPPPGPPFGPPGPPFGPQYGPPQYAPRPPDFPTYAPSPWQP